MDDSRRDDRAAIADLTIAYAYAVDERDWAAFEGLFTPDAAIDYTSSGGIAGRPAEVAAWMPDALSLFTWTMHSVSTHRIVFDGPDRAHGSLHCCARHGLEWKGGPERMEVDVVYEDVYVRTSAGWRFEARDERTIAITGGAFADALQRSLSDTASHA
jgi:hypothetical protein